jgi:hypothetical protein
MINDIRRKNTKEFIPPIPAPSPKSKTSALTPPPAPAVPDDLENQILSDNALERLRQLDFRAQETEEGVPLD